MSNPPSDLNPPDSEKKRRLMIDGPDVREPYGKERESKPSPFLPPPPPRHDWKVIPFMHPKALRAFRKHFGPKD